MASTKQNITALDLHFASLIFPILTEAAVQRKKLTYKEVRQAVQSRHPDDLKARTMHHRHVGRRLGAIWQFISKHPQCPHLGALVVLQDKGEVGDGFPKDLDPELEREKCALHDWSDVSLDFDVYMKKARSQYKRDMRPKRKKRNQVAKSEMAQHWKVAQNEIEGLREDLTSYREQIIKDIESGEAAATAFANALEHLFVDKPSVRPAERGYVYIGEYRLYDSDTPIVPQKKIGTTSRALEERSNEIGGGVVGPIEFKITHAWCFPPGFALIAEQYLHGEFDVSRQRGEFFEDEDDVLPEIANELLDEKFSDFELIMDNEIYLTKIES